MQPSRAIVAVTHEFYPQIGGIATYVREMAQAIQSEGGDIEVWGPTGAGNGLGTDYPIRCMPTQGNQDLLQLWRLYRYLKSKQTELRNKVLWLVEPAPIRALALFGIDWLPDDVSIWITFHGSELAQFKASAWWRKRVGKLVDRSEGVMFVSEVIRNDFRQWKPDYSGKILMSRCALRSDFQVEDTAAAKAPSDLLKVVTISRIHPRKGHALVIDALSRLSADLRKRVEYVIVGGGKPEHVRQLEKVAKRSGVPVRFAGRQHGEALRRSYQEIDLFVLTSLPDPRSIESFGMVYLEAAAYGKPVVAAMVGGVSEAVQDGVTGVLVPPGNVNALTEAIATLLRNPDRMKEMGDAGRKWVKTFSWRDSARIVLRGMGQG
jgi:phosphatidylinositol alpha-1,6-mannosyltransferase